MTVVSLTARTLAVCVIVDVYSALAIIPMFLLFPALKTHVPEKSDGFAAAAANANARNVQTILRIIFVFSLESNRQGGLRIQARSALSFPSWKSQPPSLGSVKSVPRYRVKQIVCQEKKRCYFPSGIAFRPGPTQDAPSRKRGKSSLSPLPAVQAPLPAASSELSGIRSSG